MTNQRKPQSWIKTLSERYRALQETRSHNMLDFIQRK